MAWRDEALLGDGVSGRPVANILVNCQYSFRGKGFIPQLSREWGTNMGPDIVFKFGVIGLGMLTSALVITAIFAF